MLFLQSKSKTMKSLLTSLVLILFTSMSLSAQKAESFGDKIKADGAISTAEFLKKINGQDSLIVKVEVKINEACQKKGCWMNVDLGDGKEMMVRFKDYAFFVPKDCGGQTAVIEGMAYREVVSVEMLRHYAEDGGKSAEEIAAITEAETRLSFEANGVLIFKGKH